jgi:hypothetical protein
MPAAVVGCCLSGICLLLESQLQKYHSFVDGYAAAAAATTTVAATTTPPLLLECRWGCLQDVELH